MTGEAGGLENGSANARRAIHETDRGAQELQGGNQAPSQAATGLERSQSHRQSSARLETAARLSSRSASALFTALPTTLAVVV